LGYPGWVRRSHLADGWPTSDQRLVVMASAAPVYAQPQLSAAKIIQASLDSRLVVTAQTPGWFAVALPGGRTGWIEASQVRRSDPGSPVPARQALLDSARALVGLPYLWGGTASAAYDCSGFVYRVFSANGVKIARDAQDQAVFGAPVDPGALQPGDLLFYAAQAGGPITHVALYWGHNQVIDAQSSAGIKLHPMAELLSMRVFVTARRLNP
jgi:cell wall-associated NlpC family hydrolase